MKYFFVIICLFVCAMVFSDDVYPKLIKYEENKTIELKKKPERIFVGYVGAMDILSELISNKNVVAAPNLCLNEKYSNCLEFSKKIPVIYSKLEAELIYKTKPDLMILASFNDPRFIEHVKKNDIPYVLISKNDTYVDILNLVDLLGKLTGEESKAEKLVKMMSEKKNILIDSAKKFDRKRVMTFDLNYYTAGNKTTLNDMIEMANLENVSASNKIVGHKKISLEELIVWNPDWIILVNESPEYKEVFLSEISKHSGLTNIKAVKEKNILVLHPKIGAALSPKFLDGVSEFIQIIHEQKPKSTK